MASGCAGEVPIHDHVICGDKGRFGATCVHTLHTEIPPVLLKKAEWDAKRIGMGCIDVSELADIQESVDVLCVRYGKCVYDAAYAKKFLSFMKRVKREVKE